MTGVEIAIVITLTMIGSIVQGSIGVGLGLVAAPALVAIDPAFTPGPLLLVAQMVGVRHIVAERESAEIQTYKNSMLGVPAGIIAAIVVLELISQRWLAIVVGSSTALAAAALLAGVTFERTRRAEVVGGFGCAFASLTAALPGPPLVCVYSDMKPSTLRPTSSMLILSVAVAGFFSLVLSGNFGSHELELLLWLFPGAVAGLVASRWVRPRIDKPWFRPLVLVVALIGGAALVVRQLVAG